MYGFNTISLRVILLPYFVCGFPNIFGSIKFAAILPISSGLELAVLAFLSQHLSIKMVSIEEMLQTGTLFPHCTRLTFH